MRLDKCRANGGPVGGKWVWIGDAEGRATQIATAEVEWQTASFEATRHSGVGNGVSLGGKESDEFAFAAASCLDKAETESRTHGILSGR